MKADWEDALDRVTAARAELQGTTHWLHWLPDVLRAAGLEVVEYAGWEARARGSGPYAPDQPSCVMWHHTATVTSPESDAYAMCEASDNAPVANLLITREGVVWVLAAGATNTNGAGGPYMLSDGVVVPVDSMNTWAVGMEMANDGLGEVWPQRQVDAAFAASNAILRTIGRSLANCLTHYEWAPTRKIDPARAEAVQGPWSPIPVTSSGTWGGESIRDEAVYRGRQAPPMTEEEDDMARQLVRNGTEAGWHTWVVGPSGKFWLPTNEAVGIQVDAFGYQPIWVTDDWMKSTGPVIGPNPSSNEWGCFD